MQHKTAYLWGLIGRFAPQGLNLVTTIVLARFLTPDDFGTIGVLSVIFIVANTLLDSGLGGSLVKEKEVSEVDCSTIFVFNVSVSLTIYLLLFLGANAIENYFNITNLSDIVRTLSLVFVLSAFGIVPKAMLDRKLAFRTSCNNSIVGSFVASIVAIISALLNAGIYSLVLYQLTEAAVTVMCNYYSSKYRFSLRFSFISLKRLLPFGVTTTITSVIDTIYENLLTTMTGKYLSVQQAGYLYQSKRIEGVSSSSIAKTIGIVSFPILTKLKDNTTAFVTEAQKTFELIIALISPILITLAIHSYAVITLLFGKEWYDAGAYLRVLAITGLFIVAETLVRFFIKALCEVRKLLYITMIKRAIGIGLILATLLSNPEYMIYAYAVSAAVGLVLNVIVYRKITAVSIGLLLMSFLRKIIPCIVYFVLFFVLHLSNYGIVIQILYSVVFLSIIYLLMLRRPGFKIKSIIKK